MGGALAMATCLMICQWKVFIESLVRSMLLAGRLVLGRNEKEHGSLKEGSDHALYEGVVWHERRHPVHHQFEYKVRYALVNLDNLPSWFRASSRRHMTAKLARSISGTSGPVYLLCMPTSVGYEQNPLSVYYCYEDTGPHGSSLVRAIAEVTNTPWGERVTFVFDPKSDEVAKPLHVSPFMDMLGSWRMHAPAPGEKLSLTIGVEHPKFGRFFVATLRARKVDPGQNPESFMWLMPQKVAIWIYWQALLLLWKGVGFVQHPKYVDGNLYKKHAHDRDAENLRKRSLKGAEARADNSRIVGGSESCPRVCTWQEAEGYPWL